MHTAQGPARDEHRAIRQHHEGESPGKLADLFDAFEKGSGLKSGLHHIDARDQVMLGKTPAGKSDQDTASQLKKNQDVEHQGVEYQGNDNQGNLSSKHHETPNLRPTSLVGSGSGERCGPLTTGWTFLNGKWQKNVFDKGSNKTEADNPAGALSTEAYSEGNEHPATMSTWRCRSGRWYKGKLDTDAQADEKTADH